MAEQFTGKCPVCERTDIRIKVSGRLREHKPPAPTDRAPGWRPACDGSDSRPLKKQYGVRKPTGVVFPFSSREEAEADLVKDGRAESVLVVPEYVPGQWGERPWVEVKASG